MPIVYVVQRQMKFDEDSGRLVPRFKTLEKAERFGTIQYLLAHSAHPFNPEIIVDELHDKLKDFTDEDYLLLIGNPSLMGMATAIASDYSDGNLKVLQWSNRHDDYVEICVRMF